MLSSTIYACLLLLTLFFALGRGTRDERQLGTVVLAGNLATILVLVLSKDSDFTHVPLAYLGVDVAAALLLCAHAVRQPTWMAVLVATFQINGTLAHAVKLASPETFNVSYAILLRLWGWPMVLTLLLAHWRPSLRAILRQSDLARMPALLRPPSMGLGHGSAMSRHPASSGPRVDASDCADSEGVASSRSGDQPGATAIGKGRRAA